MILRAYTSLILRAVSCVCKINYQIWETIGKKLFTIMLKKIFLAVAVVFSVSAFAQQQGPAAVANPKDRSEAAELLSTADHLVQYGYKTKTAMPLIQAVEIYNRVGVRPETEQRTKESVSDDVVVAQSAVKPESVQYDPEKILADATNFADGDKNLLAMIKSVSAIKGAVGGPKYAHDRVEAHSTVKYTIRFRGGETAWVIVSGDGDTDLDLYIYDENGNLIESDTDSTDQCVCSFTPRWTGNFTIKIKNLGSVYNRYVLRTN